MLGVTQYSRLMAVLNEHAQFMPIKKADPLFVGSWKHQGLKSRIDVYTQNNHVDADILPAHVFASGNLDYMRWPQTKKLFRQWASISGSPYDLQLEFHGRGQPPSFFTDKALQLYESIIHDE